jgi:1,4-dihydroxy-2-naphthoyl-CoA hydrolase
MPGMTPNELLALMPFAAASGVELDRAAPDEVAGRLAWAPERCTAGGLLHGGALMTLADTAGAVCAFLGLPPGARTATTQSGTHLLRAVSGDDVRAVARPVHTGRTQVVVQTDVTDARGRLVARTTQTQAVIPS